MRSRVFSFAMVLDREPPITVVASVWRGSEGLEDAEAVSADGYVELTDGEIRQVYEDAKKRVEQMEREARA